VSDSDRYYRNENGLPTRAYRVGRVTVHLLYGVATAAFLFPFLPAPVRVRSVRRWSVQLLQMLKVKIRIRGQVPRISAGNMMLVANHISWLDIYLLNAVCPARFVAKSEVRAWPLVGWLSHKIGTLFIERARRVDAARINREVVETLLDGGRVALFPEGTTSDGSRLRPFHAPLLQPLIDSGGMLWPVGLKFAHRDGSLNIAPAYVDDMTFGASFARVLGQAVIHAELVFAPPISARGKTRRELARDAEQAIAAALNLAAPDRRPETVADLPDARRKAALPTGTRCPTPADHPAFSAPALTSAQK
jgi:1-acyl-sn-glycerol-3-phosphate acyltransferase